MAMTPGVEAALLALSTLGQATGAAYAGSVQGDAMDEQNALARRKLLLEEQHRGEDMRRDDERYADTLAAQRRAAAQAAPANSIGLLSGLANLRQGLTRSNGIDVLGYLAKG